VLFYSVRRPSVEITRPAVFLNARSSVEARLDVAVVVNRRIGDLDDEQDIGGAGMLGGVENRLP
jgi:hypothetical protein